MPTLPADHRSRSGNPTSIGGGRCIGAGARSARREFVGKAEHESLAARELIEADPFVGLVRLGDVTGAAEDRRDARAVEQPGLTAELYFATTVAFVAAVREGDDRAV